MEQNLNHEFLNILQNNWDKKFIVDALNKKTITYEDFFYDVLKMKNYINSYNHENFLIAILPNSYNLITLYMAALFEQKVIVPIDPEKSINEINEIVSLFDNAAVICDEYHYNLLLTDKQKKILYLKDEKLTTFHRDVVISLVENIDYNRDFLITFTSGSTGKPKGVRHSFGNLVKSAVAFKERFGFNEKHIFYHNLPMSYMAGILNTFILPLFSKSKIVIGERFAFKNCSNFWQYPIQYNVNVFWFTPTILALLLKLDRSDEGKIYCATQDIIGLVGTAPLTLNVKKNFERIYKVPLYESYGLSEYLFLASNAPGKSYEKTVGTLLRGVSISNNSTNEILVKTNWDFLGYFPEGTEDTQNKDYYKTGDLGSLNEEGYLAITGRIKDIIIRGGVNISPKKIEDLLETFVQFEEFAVIGIEDELIGEKTVCFYSSELKKISQSDKVELKKLLLLQLGANYIIDEYINLDHLPKNINGKIDKIKLRELYKGLER